MLDAPIPVEPEVAQAIANAGGSPTIRFDRMFVEITWPGGGTVRVSATDESEGCGIPSALTFEVVAVGDV